MRQPQGVITENFEVILETSNKQLENRLRVGTLARVVEIDKTSKTLSVQPIVQEKINSNNNLGYKYIKLPIIRNVPYISGQYPQINDYVVCLHLDRTKSGINLLTDTSSFIESNNNRHNLNDCVAIVINTKSEWKFIGEFISAESVDVSKYSEIRAILSFGGMQLDNQMFNLTTTDIINVCQLESQGNSITFEVTDNNLAITSIVDNLTASSIGEIHLKLHLYGK